MTGFLIFCVGALCGAGLVTLLAFLAINPLENRDD